MSVRDAKQYVTDQVHYFRADIRAGSRTVSIGWIPPGAVIMDAGVTVIEGFSAGALDLGFRNTADDTEDNPSAFASGVDMGSTGIKDANGLGSAGTLHFPRGAELIATIGGGEDATEGKGIVFVTYLADNNKPIPEFT